MIIFKSTTDLQLLTSDGKGERVLGAMTTVLKLAGVEEAKALVALLEAEIRRAEDVTDFGKLVTFVNDVCKASIEDQREQGYTGHCARVEGDVIRVYTRVSRHPERNLNGGDYDYYTDIYQDGEYVFAKPDWSSSFQYSDYLNTVSARTTLAKLLEAISYELPTPITENS